MTGTLPTHPNLTHLRNEAKQLLRAQRNGQGSACEVFSLLRRFENATSKEILSASVALHESQYALALHYGFDSWKQLVGHVRVTRQSPDARERLLVDQNSLASTIDAINDAVFFGKNLSPSQKQSAAEFIVGLYGLDGAYQGLFAPTDADRAEGFRLFTGEKVKPGPGASHILAEEACRALLLLGVKTDAGARAMKAAQQIVNGWVDESLAKPVRPAGSIQPGMFCCMKCSCALWRHIAVRKDSRRNAFLSAGVKALRLSRDGEGGWWLWPWHYTLLVLCEMDTPEAEEELQYAAEACERQLTKRFSKANVYSQRRRAVIERALVGVQQREDDK